MSAGENAPHEPMMWFVCPKCYGEKRIERFRHRQRGVCFRCRGKGKVLIPRSALFAVDY